MEKSSMPIDLAEHCFARGLAALADANPVEATALFAGAIEIEARHRAPVPNMRYLSYYGHSLDQLRLDDATALRACEEAARRDPAQPTAWLNLGRAYARRGRVDDASSCFERGLHLAPEHFLLQRALRTVDRRGRATIPFLRRSNPLNRWTGKLRAALGHRGLSPRSAQEGSNR
jgi:tetratricopeptide (TPR) repeat protein